MKLSQYYTLKDVCYMTRKSSDTIRRWVNAGNFPPPIQPYANSTWLFKPSDIEAWEQSSRLNV